MTNNFANDRSSLGTVRGAVDGTDGDDLIVLGYTDDDGDYVNINENTIYGHGGNDTIISAGADEIYGGDGSDRIEGGGSDILNGDAGDDTIILDSGGTASGGSGDDLFFIEGSLRKSGGTIHIDGGDDALNGHRDDDANGNAGDILDLRYFNLVTVNYDSDDHTSGVAEAIGQQGGVFRIYFTGVEQILQPGLTEPDGIVDGLQFDDVFGFGDQDADGDAVTHCDDTIYGYEGNDNLNGAQGDDYIDGGAGNDIIAGSYGNDTLLGGDGADVLDGGEGSDVVVGGAGDDDITLSAGDSGTGNSGDDYFRIDDTAPGSCDINIMGGSDGTNGAPDDDANGDQGDVLDLRGLDLQDTIGYTLPDGAEGGFGLGYWLNDPGTIDPGLNFGPDPFLDGYFPAEGSSGTAFFKNEDGETVRINFSGIEKVLFDPQQIPNGTVDGTDSDDDIGPGYTDADGDMITDGNDDIDGGKGNDIFQDDHGTNQVDGGDGYDILKLKGSPWDYSFEFDGDHDIILIHQDGTRHELRNVEAVCVEDVEYPIQDVIDYAKSLEDDDGDGPVTEGDDLIEAPTDTCYTIDGQGGNDTLVLDGQVSDYQLYFDGGDHDVIIAAEGKNGIAISNIEHVMVEGTCYSIEEVIAYANEIGATELGSGYTSDWPTYGEAEQA